MINNFDQLKRLYSEHPLVDSPDTFLFGQIMLRKKDGSEVSSNNKIIKDIVFRTLEDFDSKREEIIALCDFYKARAYINVNPRSYKEVAIEMAGLCLDYIRRGSENASRTAFSTVCGRMKPKNSYWVVDVDDTAIAKSVYDLIPETPEVVRTVNGFHFLTKGFDSRELKQQFPQVDIHKNNPTLLYFGG